MIASAAGSGAGESAATSAGAAATTLCAGSRTPITPVDAVEHALGRDAERLRDRARGSRATSASPAGAGQRVRVAAVDDDRADRRPPARARARRRSAPRPRRFVVKQPAAAAGTSLDDERDVAPHRLEAGVDAREPKALRDLHDDCMIYAASMQNASARRAPAPRRAPARATARAGTHGASRSAMPTHAHQLDPVGAPRRDPLALRVLDRKNELRRCPRRARSARCPRTPGDRDRARDNLSADHGRSRTPVGRHRAQADRLARVAASTSRSRSPSASAPSGPSGCANTELR